MKDRLIAYILCGTSKCRALQKGNLLHRSAKFNIQHGRYSSFTSRVGFHDYEKECQTHKLIVPEKFNFASDVLDKWAQKERTGERDSSSPAFWYAYENGKEVKFNYQDWEIQTKRAASILESRCGIKYGDNVMVMLPKIPEFWLVSVAALRIGFVMSPATMMLTAKDLSYRFSLFKPSCIIADETAADIVDEVADSCPSLKEKVIVSATPSRRKGWLDFNRLEPETENHKCAVTNSNDTMMIFFTSGTSGYPKMVEQTYASYGIGLETLGKYFLDLTSKNIFWNMSDTGWAKIAYSSIFASWSRGACVFVHQMTRFIPTTVLEVLSKYPVDTLCAPPLVFRALVQEKIADYKFCKLEHCTSGGETLSPEVVKKWMAATGIKIYEGYGQTETTGLIGMLKCFEFKMGSMGKPLPGLDIAIVDKDGNEVGPGIKGEMVLKLEKSPVGVLKSYKNDPELTKSKLTEKYFYTGDMAYYDEEGYFWYVGRDDDLINSAGYRIGPSEVENALMEHPAVVEVAVISSPDPTRGEIVKAVIVLKKSTEGSEELVKELQEHCKRVTAPYKYPRKIEFAQDLPKTISGKIKRAELKQKEWKNT